PVEITKNAMEMPMVRRISIRRCLLLAAHPGASASDRAASQMVLDRLRDADRCRPGLLGCIRVGQGGTAQAKPRKTQMSTPPAPFVVNHGLPDCRRLSYAP